MTYRIDKQFPENPEGMNKVVLLHEHFPGKYLHCDRDRKYS